MQKVHVYLFRHGQSYYNRDHKFAGWKDSVLTPRGFRDARKVAQKLKRKKIDIAFSSDLTRSRQTLREVLKFHPHVKVYVDSRLRERNYGRLSGHSHSSTIKKYGKEQFDIWHRSYDCPPPRGESIRMVEKRVESFIKDMMKTIRMGRMNVAISAHGNSMRPFRRHFEKLTVKQMMKLENPWDDYFEYVVKV